MNQSAMGAWGEAAIEGGVGVDDAGGGVEAGIGDAPHADLAVVVGDVVNEPLDGVVGVGAFVGILGAALDGAVRRHVDEIAFGHVAAADVLVDEDELLAAEFIRRAEGGLVVLHAVGPDAVGRAGQHDGIGFGGVLGDVDAGEEALAIAHGNLEFVLGIVRLDEFEALPVTREGEAQDSKEARGYHRDH